MSKKVLVVEDDVLIAYHIAEILSNIQDITIEMEHSYAEALEKVHFFKPDLIVLDINLNDKKDGIFLAEELNSTIPIIYITANTDLEKLHQAINQNPIAILTKPIKKIDLISNVTLFFNQNKTSKVSFKSNGEQIFVDENDIFYGKIEDNYLFLFTVSQKFVIRTSIDSFLALKDFKHTYKCHRSFLINTTKVEKVKQNSLIINGVEIPVSRSFKQEVFGIIINTSN
jgi:DNA-binding LytR/AlgR family response regulator